MKTDRFLTAILAGIALLVVLSLALYFLRRDGADYLPGNTPSEVVHNYALALQRGDTDMAYSYVAETPTSPDLALFRQSLINGRSEISSAAIEIGEASETGDTAQVSVTILRTSGGLFASIYRDPQIALLERQAGRWKITQMPYPYWMWDWSENTIPAKPAPALD